MGRLAAEAMSTAEVVVQKIFDYVQYLVESLSGISIDCAEILKIWKLVDDLLKRPNTKGVLGIHQLTNKIH